MTANTRLIPNETATNIVTYTIKINGEAISRQYNVLSILICREINRIPMARISLIDGNASTQDFPVSNEGLFIPGNEIEILMGYHSTEESVFLGMITSQSIKVRRGGAQLTIECKDPAVRMTIGSKSKFFPELTDSDVMEEIIGTYDLEAEVEATEIEHLEMVQFETTDWDFLLSRAEANGKVVNVLDGKVTVKEPILEADADLVVQFGSSMEEFDAVIDSRYQYTGVKALSWDKANQEILEAEAVEPSLEEVGNIGTDELADVIGLETYNLYHAGAVSADELQAWADAQLLKSRLSKIRGRVKYQGYGLFGVGDTLQLVGVGDRMSGKVYVTGIRHELSGGNWYTDAQFGLDPCFFSKKQYIHTPKAAGLLAAVNGLQIGVVSQLEEDPEGEDRIKVKLPIISPDDDGIWARLATLDAGPDRGIIFHPEVGDEVIIGFINDDPRDPVILGRLFSSAMPSPITATADNFEKGIITNSQIKLIFNDDESSILLETPGGNSLLINDNEGIIQLEDQSGNKILMDSAGITLESAGALNLKAAQGDIVVDGMNVEAKAAANMKVEANAMLELKSGGIAKLEGSLVQIN